MMMPLYETPTNPCANIVIILYTLHHVVPSQVPVSCSYTRSLSDLYCVLVCVCACICLDATGGLCLYIVSVCMWCRVSFIARTQKHFGFDNKTIYIALDAGLVAGCGSAIAIGLIGIWCLFSVFK